MTALTGGGFKPKIICSILGTVTHQASPTAVFTCRRSISKHPVVSRIICQHRRFDTVPTHSNTVFCFLFFVVFVFSRFLFLPCCRFLQLYLVAIILCVRKLLYLGRAIQLMFHRRCCCLQVHQCCLGVKKNAYPVTSMRGLLSDHVSCQILSDQVCARSLELPFCVLTGSGRG